MDVQRLLPWIQQSLKDKSHLLAKGYQGQALLYVDDTSKIVIKTPHGRGLIKYFHTRMLRHEYKVYQRLQGLSCVPKCYGLVANTYLALEYIESSTIRQNRPEEGSAFYPQLFKAIEQIHQRNIAHADLKKKDNLLVSVDGKPVIIDFGVAVIYKAGSYFWSQYFYDLGRQFDYNAWIKHKYFSRMDEISDSDRPYCKRSLPEKLAGQLKQKYLFVKNFLYK